MTPLELLYEKPGLPSFGLPAPLATAVHSRSLTAMVILPPPDRPAVAGSPSVSILEKTLRSLSVFTMLMTVPQVLAIWVGRDAHNVSLISWAAYLLSACLWFVYGMRKRDKTIYLACVGWILLDAAIVIGVVIYG